MVQMKGAWAVPERMQIAMLLVRIMQVFTNGPLTVEIIMQSVARPTLFTTPAVMVGVGVGRRIMAREHVPGSMPAVFRGGNVRLLVVRELKPDSASTPVVE